MDVDPEAKKSKIMPKLDLQLLTYTRGKSKKASSYTRSSRPVFSIQFLDSAILGLDNKGKGPYLESIESPSETHSLISQFQHIATIGE